MQALRPGDPVEIGGFPLLARLGEGGMGEVYLAISRGGMHVAVKVISSRFTAAQAHARFRREVETVRLVRSRFAAALVGAGVQDPPYWLATEYVPGPTLKEAVQRYGPLPPETCLRLMAALAECLADVHRQGVQHRDLKPANVILGHDGPRLIDFGIARGEGQEQITRTGTWTGTPGFVAPEVIDGRPPSAASDVFSLAGTIAYAATGRPPFGDGNASAIAHRTLAGALDLADVDDRLAGLLNRCAAKDPDERIGPEEIMRLCAVSDSLAEHPGYRRLVALTMPPPADLRAAIADGLVPPEHGRTLVATSVTSAHPRRRTAVVAGATALAAAVAAVLLIFQGIPGSAGDSGAGRKGAGGNSATAGSGPLGTQTGGGTSTPTRTGRTGSTATKTAVKAPAIKSIDQRVGSLEWNPATNTCDKKVKPDDPVLASTLRMAHTPARPQPGDSVDLKLLFEWMRPSGYYLAAQVRPPADGRLGGNQVTGIVNTKAMLYPVKGDPRNQATLADALTVTYPEDFSWPGSGSESFPLSAGAWTVVWYHIPANGRAEPIGCTGFSVT